MKNNFLKGLLLLSLVTLSFASCKGNNSDSSGSNAGAQVSGDAVTLKFNLKEGQKYLYSSDMKQKTKSMGQEMTNNMLVDYIYEVKSSTGENKVLSVTYDRIKLDMNAMGQVMSYDSKDSSASKGMIAESMKDFKGKNFSVTIAPNGEIVKVDGFENLTNSGTPINANSIKEMMENVFNIYPDKPVKIGEQWKKTMNLNMQTITMKIDMTYTLKEINGDKALFDVVGKITSELGKDMKEMAGMKMEMSGTQSGNMEVEISTGMMISGKVQQVIKGKMTMAGQEMPMDITTDITTTGKKI